MKNRWNIIQIQALELSKLSLNKWIQIRFLILGTCSSAIAMAYARLYLWRRMPLLEHALNPAIESACMPLHLAWTLISPRQRPCAWPPLLRKRVLLHRECGVLAMWVLYVTAISVVPHALDTNKTKKSWIDACLVVLGPETHLNPLGSKPNMQTTPNHLPIYWNPKITNPRLFRHMIAVRSY